LPPSADTGEEALEGEAGRQEAAAAPWIERLLARGGLWRRQDTTGAPSQPPSSTAEGPSDNEAGIQAAAAPLPQPPLTGPESLEGEGPAGDGAVGAALSSARSPTGRERPKGEAGGRETAGTARPQPPPSSGPESPGRGIAAGALAAAGAAASQPPHSTGQEPPEGEAGRPEAAAALSAPDEHASFGPRKVDEESYASNQPTGRESDAKPGVPGSHPAATSEKPVEQADEDARARDKAVEESRKRRRPWVLAIGLVVIALLIAGGLYYWWSTRNLESTDDAYTDGRAITIAPQVAGEVISLDVNDNQFMKQGQALIHIDPRQYKNSRDQAEGALATAKAQYAGQQLSAEVAKKNFPALLEQAKAQLESAKANLAKTQADYARQISLQRPATTQQDVDQAATARWQAEAQVKLAEAQVKQNSPVPQQIGQSEAQVKQLKGQVEQAQAQLDQAELNLSWTIVTAPQEGWVTRRNVEKGNYVVAGQQILSIVTPEVWVTANFKETQLTYMRPGQPVKIRIDAYPSLDVRGHVDSIQRGSGSKFTAFPPENATGNFVKIVQRVPVKIVIDSGIPPDIAMPLGISVVPTVTVR
jgi:membrane fusion protein (multidrug efflux system)